MNQTPHLFVDISAHGFGHLAQVAPILNALASRMPKLRLTVRSALPLERLRIRLKPDFVHIAKSSDFGFVMLDAVQIDYAATATAYRAQYANWSQRVAEEARFLTQQRPDLVLTDVAYLPLAGAAQAGIPAVSMCSLNWADLFANAFDQETWAQPIHREILAAYNSAECFLRLTPGMPMDALQRLKPIAPVAALGENRRETLRQKLACNPDERVVLIAFGGFDKDLAADSWPRIDGIRWLIPQSWQLDREDMTAVESLAMLFTDLLSSVDAALTKPGYGTFTEAACNGTPVLYLKRDNWPEQTPLIEWLEQNARCREVSAADLMAGNLGSVLAELWQQTPPQLPQPTGAQEVATFLLNRLAAGRQNVAAA